MAKYHVRSNDGGEESFMAESMAEACELARDWLREGDYADSDRTVYVGASVWPDGGKDDHEHITVQIDPPEPKCSGGSHDWSDDGAEGHGGGVIMWACCERCGTRRKTDTWATNQVTGQEGLRSISYQSTADDES